MDKALFVAMGGQNNAMQELQILSNNLANVNTPGFRADYNTVQQNHIQSGKMETRVYASVGQSYSDLKQGPTLSTDRDLDVAISGSGMFAVQSKTGDEGYTRAGNFELSSDGFLTTSDGKMVLGTSGAINIPQAEKIHISKNGTVSFKPVGSPEMVAVGQLKLVNPSADQIHKGQDGLFYTNDAARLTPDASVKVASGSLEGSNVNPVETLIKLIDISRSYEIHSNFMKNLSDASAQSNKLLDIKG